jgi:hypothetical protein
VRLECCFVAVQRVGLLATIPLPLGQVMWGRELGGMEADDLLAALPGVSATDRPWPIAQWPGVACSSPRQVGSWARTQVMDLDSEARRALVVAGATPARQCSGRRRDALVSRGLPGGYRGKPLNDHAPGGLDRGTGRGQGDLRTPRMAARGSACLRLDRVRLAQATDRQAELARSSQTPVRLARLTSCS